MNKVSLFFDRNRKRVWFAIAVNILFLLFLLLVTRPYFETNDDITLACFFNRARGVQDAYTDLSNWIFGALLSLCYRITAQLPWYILFLYGAVFISLTTVTHILLSRFDGWAGGMLACVFMVFFGYECYTAVNFTKAAGCAAAAGACLIYFSVKEEKLHLSGVIFGALMILMGYVIRPEEGMGAAASTIAGALFLVLRIPRDVEKGKRGRRFLRYVLSALLAVVLVAGAKGADIYARISSPERQAYDEYMGVRTQIMDYGFPNFSRNQEAYQKLDINKNAWQLYRTWNFYDTEKFPAEVMQKVADLQPERKLDRQAVRDFLKQYPDKFFENQIFLVYLFVLVLVILYGIRSRETFFSVILHLAVMGLLFFYLFFEGRYGLRRVDVGIWWGGVLGLLVMLDPQAFHVDKKAAIAIMFFALIIDQVSWEPHYRRQTQDERDAQVEKRNIVSELSSDKDHLYICMSGSYYPTGAFGPLDRIPVGAVSNIITLGGWAAQSIPFVSVYQSYGISNPFRDMIGNETVRVITKDEKRLVRYLQDYYDPACRAEVIGSVKNNKIIVIRK